MGQRSQKSTHNRRKAGLGAAVAVLATAFALVGSSALGSTAAQAQYAPSNTVAPTVTGSAAVTQVVTANVGTWTGDQPIVFEFQWQRCNNGGQNCVSIPDARSQTYTVASTDAGATLRVTVTARNSQGSASAISAATGVVGQAPGPAGAIKLPSGETSIPVTSVPKGERLIVDRVGFTPSPVRSRTQPIQARIKVMDTRGYVVRDAIVFIRSTPLVTTAQDSGRTQQDGTIIYTMLPERDFPAIRNSYSIQFFVKAYRQGDDPLAGVSGTRLVQVPMSR